MRGSSLPVVPFRLVREVRAMDQSVKSGPRGVWTMEVRGELLSGVCDFDASMPPKRMVPRCASWLLSQTLKRRWEM